MIALFLLAVTPEAMAAVDVSDGDHAYVCEVQVTSPGFTRLKDVLISINDGVWMFDPDLASQMGVATAALEQGGADILGVAEMPSEKGFKFTSKMTVADAESNRTTFSWEVRGDVEGVDSDALVGSGVGICDFKPVYAKTERSAA